jgi:hypothetical protein
MVSANWRGKPPDTPTHLEYEKQTTLAQARWLELSSNAKQIFARNSSEYIQFDELETVINATREVYDQANVLEKGSAAHMPAAARQVAYPRLPGSSRDDGGPGGQSWWPRHPCMGKPGACVFRVCLLRHLHADSAYGRYVLSRQVLSSSPLRTPASTVGRARTIHMGSRIQHHSLFRIVRHPPKPDHLLMRLPHSPRIRPVESRSPGFTSSARCFLATRHRVGRR